MAVVQGDNMVLVGRSSMLALLLVVSVASAAEPEGQCAKIHCDCKVFVDSNLTQDCQTQERKIQAECVSNGGKIQNYCGLHGPAGFPVATSLQSQELVLSSDEDAGMLAKQADTQNWSVAETYKAFEVAIKANEYSRALPLANLVEKDSTKLYSFHKQSVNALIKANKAAEALVLAQTYGNLNSEKAALLALYSDQLWQTFPTVTDAEQRRIIQMLSFKMARTAAAVFEYSADLQADAGQVEAAANLWQRSAAIAQKLIGWETAVGNDAQKLRYYQAQAAARWNRATYYWLQAKKLDQVVNSRKSAQSASN